MAIIDSFVQQTTQQIADMVSAAEDGDVTALTAYADLKELLSFVNHAVKQVEPIAMQEAELYPGKSFDHQGVQFEKRNGATRYSFKHIPQWQSKKSELKEIEDQAKQAFIAKQKGMLTATEDGEEIPLPEVSYSKDSLIIKKGGY